MNEETLPSVLRDYIKRKCLRTLKERVRKTAKTHPKLSKLGLLFKLPDTRSTRRVDLIPRSGSTKRKASDPCASVVPALNVKRYKPRYKPRRLKLEQDKLAYAEFLHSAYVTIVNKGELHPIPPYLGWFSKQVSSIFRRAGHKLIASDARKGVMFKELRSTVKSREVDQMYTKPTKLEEPALQALLDQQSAGNQTNTS